MTLGDLVEEFASVRAPGWLVLRPDEMIQCAIEAARYYAAYGDIKSLSGSDPLPGAAGDPTPIVYQQPDPVSFTYPTPESIYTLPAPQAAGPFSGPIVYDALPVKDPGMIDEDTDISTGEWAVIRPLFVLYCERENAARLEASRALGLDVYGRSVSEIAGEIHAMENETIPNKAAVALAIEVS